MARLRSHTIGHMGPAARAIADLAARQDGVVTTAQCLDRGADPRWVSRQVAAGHWQRVHQGVLVVHAGPLPWRTVARSALLYAGPRAALSHAAAGYVYGQVEKPPRVVDVSVPRARWVRPSAGVVVHRVDRPLERRAGFVVVERADTALDLLAQARTDDDVVGRLCAAARAGVWPEQVREALARRTRTPNRALVSEMLALVDDGIESPLEMRYHRDVERRHGLPDAVLQRRQVIDGRWIRADGVYQGLGVRRELDGELAHPGGSTHTDVLRDNAVLIAHSEITLRYRWSHVAGIPCVTAVQVVAALRSRGWRGVPRRCGPGCPVE